MAQQKTINKKVSVKGKGLFSGIEACVTIHPAPIDHGIVFVRTDIPDSKPIAVSIANVLKKQQRTALQQDGAVVETTEHFLAAVYGLQINNLRVEIDAQELPNVDGSADLFTNALQDAGVVVQDKQVECFIITKPVVVSEGDAMIYALPDRDDELSIIYDLDYTGVPHIGRQLRSFTLTTERFISDISSARTFSTQSQANDLQRAGIATHLTPKEMLVVGDDGPVDNEFRFKDECVRHKILDMLGDLMLLGKPICGRIVANRSGHSINQLLVKRLLESIKKEKPTLLSPEKSAYNTVLDVRKIQKILPHRYPFLLVDRVIEIDGENRAVGLKNVSMNELFFQGHYPKQPIMPGVLIVEALAQMSGLMFAQKLENIGQLPVLLGMEKVKLRKAVVPGDQLILEVEVIRMRSRTAISQCRAYVDGKLAAEAQLKFMIVDSDPV